MSTQERDTQPEWTPEPLKKAKHVGTKSSRPMVYGLIIMLGCAVSGILAYKAAVSDVRAESTTVSKLVAVEAIADHAKSDAEKFRDIASQLRELNNKLDENQKINNEALQRILLEMQRNRR